MIGGRRTAASPVEEHSIARQLRGKSGHLAFTAAKPLRLMAFGDDSEMLMMYRKRIDKQFQVFPQ